MQRRLRAAQSVISAAVCLGLVVVAPMALARPAPAAGLPPGLRDAPLPGVAGETARSARKGEVRFVSPAVLSIAAGRAVPVELNFEVSQGFHINSHTPLDWILIPTRIDTQKAEGVRIVSVHFPPGENYHPAFAPKEKLNVYSGKFAVRMVLEAKPGKHTIDAALHYQACDVNACRPPHTLPVQLAVIAK